MIRKRQTGIIQIEGDDSGKCLQRKADGSMLIQPLKDHAIQFTEGVIPARNIFDMMTPAMNLLLEDIAPSSMLQQELLAEWIPAQKNILDPDSSEYMGYGVWTYYPSKNHLVRFAPEKWHKAALTVRNSSLLSPIGKPHAWREGREILSGAVLAVAGASVGSNIFHSSAMLLRPRAMKTADAKNYQVNNANRVRLSYSELARNKAQVVAEQLQTIDPFTEVYVYPDGVNAGSMTGFLDGNRETGEPAATIVVEETDDPNAKIALREQCRKRGIPVVMLGDLGGVVQIEVRRYDRDSTLGLAYGMPDETLYEVKRRWDADVCNRNLLLEVFYALIGREGVCMDERFKEILFQEVPVEFSGLPQLGSTAALGGGLAAWVVVQIVLGGKVAERMYFNPLTQNLISKGRML